MVTYSLLFDQCFAVMGTLIVFERSSGGKGGGDGVGGIEQTTVLTTVVGDAKRPPCTTRANHDDGPDEVSSKALSKAASGMDHSKIPFPPKANLLSVLATTWLLKRTEQLEQARPRRWRYGPPLPCTTGAVWCCAPLRRCRGGAAHFELDPNRMPVACCCKKVNENTFACSRSSLDTDLDQQ
jgi:hypothetical protein